jgi:hypothetical protein
VKAEAKSKRSGSDIRFVIEEKTKVGREKKNGEYPETGRLLKGEGVPK